MNADEFRIMIKDLNHASSARREIKTKIRNPTGKHLQIHSQIVENIDQCIVF